MHLPFIAHTHARQMYVTIMCMRLKRTFCFIGCWIVLISVQDDGDGCVKVLRRMNYLSQARGSLANNIPLHAIESSQSRVLTRRSSFTTHVKRIVRPYLFDVMLRGPDRPTFFKFKLIMKITCMHLYQTLLHYYFYLLNCNREARVFMPF